MLLFISLDKSQSVLSEKFGKKKVYVITTYFDMISID